MFKFDIQLFSGAEDISPQKQITAEHNNGDYSKSQIAGEKPRVSRSGYKVMRAPYATGTHGAKVTPFCAFEYLAGAKIKDFSAKFILKMQPLAHPTLDTLKLKMFAIYVPNTRVWLPKDADAFSSQKEDRYLPKVLSPPMAAPNGASIASIAGTTSLAFTTTMWRESLAYHYFGKDGVHSSTMAWNFLYPRGFKALYNDIFRDKSAHAPYIEYNSTVVSTPERNSVFHFGRVDSALTIEEILNEGTSNWDLYRAPLDETYQNSFRPSVFTQNNPVDNTDLLTHIQSQQITDEVRSQAQNINKTDAEILAEMRGTVIAKQNQCYIIGQKTIDIDISLQPQTVEGALPLGAEGAISYTFGSADIITEQFSAPKDGIIHLVYYIQAPDQSIWANGINVEHTKSLWSDFYRPGLANIKDAPFYQRELSGAMGTNNWNDVGGWKRNFSEYFRLPTYIRGDFVQFNRLLDGEQPRTNRRGFGCALLTHGQTGDPNLNGWHSLPSKSDWHLLKTTEEMGVAGVITNRIDHTDTLLRRVLLVNGGNLETRVFNRRTEQTFYMYGSLKATIDQPIDPSIKNEFIRYGEE